MTGPLVFISHFRIKEGRLDDLKQHHERVVEIIKADKPGTVVFLHYLNEEGTEYSIVHVFPDAEAMDRHLEGAIDRSKAAYEFIEPVRREVYGMPTEKALATLKPTADSGSTFNFMPQDMGGYIRLKSE